MVKQVIAACMGLVSSVSLGGESLALELLEDGLLPVIAQAWRQHLADSRVVLACAAAVANLAVTSRVSL